MARARKALSFSLVGATGLGMALWLGFVFAGSMGDQLWASNSKSCLRNIHMRLMICQKPVADLLSCSEEGKVPSIVSAEEVWAQTLGQEDLHYLLNPSYKMAAALRNPRGQTDLEKWGASFESWLMSHRKWDDAALFVWQSQQKDDLLGYRFPLLWEKMPQPPRKNVCFLALGGAVYCWDRAQFDPYLKAAKGWVNSGHVSLKEIENKLTNGSTKEQVFAIRLLGLKRDPHGIGLLRNFARREEIEVRIATVGASGMIGGETAVALLRECVGDSAASVRREVAAALGKMTDSNVTDDLVKLLKDDKAEVRRAAAESLGGMENRASIAALKEALVDQDRRTRQAALESLLKLAWRPGEQTQK